MVGLPRREERLFLLAMAFQSGSGIGVSRSPKSIWKFLNALRATLSQTFPHCHLEELVSLCISICCYSTALRIKLSFWFVSALKWEALRKYVGVVIGASLGTYPWLVENLKSWAYHLLPLNFPSHSHFLYFSFEPRYLRQFLYYGFKSSWNMQTPWELIKKKQHITCIFSLRSFFLFCVFVSPCSPFT